MVETVGSGVNEGNALGERVTLKVGSLLGLLIGILDSLNDGWPVTVGIALTGLILGTNVGTIEGSNDGSV